ncbi:hypothetical protein GOP47_0016431 [Adiantum capillus-veneris]|uniref:Uncharacterized protein n=1 Tax=Adiantum capillus-veneris TaxID=13818 RepID=A0A9D4UIP6_ADICA|nr:hypothetical protein GOP47_0016431 [Adiantum capillus-veneris]
MALDVLEQIQEQCCHDDLLQQQQQQQQQQRENAADEVVAPQQHEVDTFLREAVNSRNRITVLRLEQEIERFARNMSELDLLLKPMQSSYERLAAHRIAQHYGLQSMVVSASFPKVSRILLVKTSETRLPSVRLADIPLESLATDKPVSAPNEKIAIKQRASRVSNGEGLNGSAESGRNPPKTMEEREEEYDKARARIFNSGDSANAFNGEIGISDLVDRQKVPESSSPTRGLISPSGGEGKSQPANSNRVAIFRDREKDMKDPDYDRSYKRYPQLLDPSASAIFPALQRMYSPINVYDKYPHLDGPWAPQLQVEQSTYMPTLPFRGPRVESCYPDVSYAHYGQNHSDAYWQCQRFPAQAHTGHYTHLKDGFPYSFQHGLQSTMSLGTLGR